MATAIEHVSKDLEPLAKLAVKQGWELSLNPKGQIVWKSPDKTQPLVFTSMSTNGRNLKNTRAALVRSGLDVTELKPGQPKTPDSEVLELAEQVRAEIPQVAAKIDELVGGPESYDAAMAVFLSSISLALRDYVNARGYSDDATLTEAMGLMEQADAEIVKLREEVADLKEQAKKANIECVEAQRKEAAALERANAAENKFNTLKKLLND